MATPIFVFSGFLGAGKTTLINHLLETAPPNVRILVLVNEFGRISIDKRLVRTEPDRVVDLSGGCVCCGLLFELVASIRFALDDFRADHIWIESTGLAVPQEIFRQALSPAFEGRVAFGAIVTVVEPAGLLSNEFPVVTEQLREASVVVLNKIDTLNSSDRERVRDRIAACVPVGTPVLETTHGRIAYDQIFSHRYDGTRILREYAGPRAAPFDSTAGFSTLCLLHDRPIRKANLAALYRAVGPKIVRSKGLILTDRGPFVVQFTRQGLSWEETEPFPGWSQLVLIVRDEDRSSVQEAFGKLFSRTLE